MKITATTTIVTGVLIGVWLIFSTGIKGMVQDQAKQAVQDTVVQNSDRIKKLEEKIEENIREDVSVHPQVLQLKSQITALEKQVDSLETRTTELNNSINALNTKIDRLTDLLIKYIDAIK